MKKIHKKREEREIDPSVAPVVAAFAESRDVSGGIVSVNTADLFSFSNSILGDDAQHRHGGFRRRLTRRFARGPSHRLGMHFYQKNLSIFQNGAFTYKFFWSRQEIRHGLFRSSIRYFSSVDSANERTGVMTTPGTSSAGGGFLHLTQFLGIDC